MNLTFKKDIFFCMLGLFFGDKDERINDDNCIDFYHHIVDGLEKEMKKKDEENQDIYFTYNYLIYFLTKFEKMDNSSLFSMLIETQNFVDLVSFNSGARCSAIKKDLVTISHKYAELKEKFFS